MINQSWKRNLVFLVLLTATFLLCRCYDYINLFPSGPHSWRQADCLSITDNYYSNGMRFFQPELHYQISDGGTQGYTAGEFPGLYYLNALLWIIFGKHIFITRLVSVVITFLGLLALHKTYWNISRNYFWSVIWPLLIFCTPVIAEYGMSFLTDVPGFAFALMGWYFFERFRNTGKYSSLIKTAVLFMIAGLLKVSSLILFVVIIIIWGFETIGIPLGINNRRIFERLKASGLLLFSSLVGVFAWYYYAESFNSTHGGKYTFNHPWPIWKIPAKEIIDQAVGFWEWTAVFTLPLYFWHALVVVFVTGVALMRWTPAFYRLAFSLTATGVFLYTALWYQAIDEHDYYFINAFALVVVLPFPFLTSSVNLPKGLKNVAMGLGIVALLYGFVYTRHNLDIRHRPSYGFSYPLMPEKAVELMKFYNWERKSRIGALSNSNTHAFLDSLGVSKEKKVIVFPDATFNLTLLMIDRKGWTSFGGRPLRMIVDSKIEQGADFLIVLEPDVYEQPDMCIFEGFIIGTLENVDVIDLKSFAKSQLELAKPK